MITPYFLDLLRLRRNLKIIHAHHQHCIGISSNSTQSDCLSSATGSYVLVAHFHFRPHGCQMNVQCTMHFPLNQWTTVKNIFHVCTYLHACECVCVCGGGVRACDVHFIHPSWDTWASLKSSQTTSFWTWFIAETQIYITCTVPVLRTADFAKSRVIAKDPHFYHANLF